MARQDKENSRNHDPAWNDLIYKMYSKVRGLGRMLLAEHVERGDLGPDDVDAATLRAVAKALPLWDSKRGKFTTFIGRPIRWEATHVIRDLTNRHKGAAWGDKPKKPPPQIVQLEDARWPGSQKTIGDSLRAHGPSPESQVVKKQHMERVKKSLRLLPPIQEQVIRLHHLESFSELEIARRLKLSRREVHIALAAGMKKLKKLMND